MIGQLANPSFLRYNKANSHCAFVIDEETRTFTARKTLLQTDIDINEYEAAQPEIIKWRNWTDE